MTSKTPYLIAEIGCNHRGSLATAIEMINIAALFCKVDAVKFQKRSPRELLSPAQFDAPHPDPRHSYGATYGLHREALEFSPRQHEELFEACRRVGVAYSSSVWDVTSAKQILALGPAFIKVPSACNSHGDLLTCLAADFPGEIHVSLGMTSRSEEEALVAFFAKENRLRDVVLYSCTSAYPVSFDDLALLEIVRLKQSYGADVKGIGFSGHHLGIAADVAALALGASWVERHFTLDRTWKGTDHAASLEPDGMRRLGRDLRNVARALTHKKTEILAVEEAQRSKLKWQK